MRALLLFLALVAATGSQASEEAVRAFIRMSFATSGRFGIPKVFEFLPNKITDSKFPDVLFVSRDYAVSVTGERKTTTTCYLFSKADHTLRPSDITLEEFTTRYGMNTLPDPQDHAALAIRRQANAHVILIEQEESGYSFNVGYYRCNNTIGFIKRDPLTSELKVANSMFNCCF